MYYVCCIYYPVRSFSQTHFLSQYLKNFYYLVVIAPNFIQIYIYMFIYVCQTYTNLCKFVCLTVCLFLKSKCMKCEMNHVYNEDDDLNNIPRL